MPTLTHARTNKRTRTRIDTAVRAHFPRDGHLYPKGKGGVGHLNTKNIGQLESELAELHTTLSKLELHLKVGAAAVGGGGGGGGGRRSSRNGSDGAFSTASRPGSARPGSSRHGSASSRPSTATSSTGGRQDATAASLVDRGRFEDAVSDSLAAVKKAAHNLLSLSQLGPEPPTTLAGFAKVGGSGASVPALPSAEEMVALLPITRDKANARQTLGVFLSAVKRSLQMQANAADAVRMEVSEYVAAVTASAAAAVDAGGGARRVYDRSPRGFGVRDFRNAAGGGTDAAASAEAEAEAALGRQAKEVLMLPLQQILTAYAAMKEDKTELALRDFLATFKDHAEALLSVDEEIRAAEALFPNA